MDKVAKASGTFKIGGELEVTRLGFGALRITGEGFWGQPRDRDAMIALLRRLPELGINLVDTADAYGPFVSEELIHEALHPYDDITVSTKAGIVRTGPFKRNSGGPHVVHAVGRPEYLRQCCEMSLRRLGVETIDLWHLHRIDPKVPREEQFGLAKELQNEGKVRHIGLSEVTIDDIEAAQEIFEVRSVQNQYNPSTRGAEEVLEYCEERGIAFLPWAPLGRGDLSEPTGPLAKVAEAHGATTSQVALAWLLQRSEVMLPIPGTSSMEHLEENAAAAALELTEQQVADLDAVIGTISET